VPQLEVWRIVVGLNVRALRLDGGSDRCLGQHVQHGGAVEAERVTERESLAERGDRYAED